MDEMIAGTVNQKSEDFVRWFLRFNGYFGIENFVVHAADDQSRISDGTIAPHTETDTIAIRMPYSCEVSGKLHIANFPALTDGSLGKFDVLVVETKSGKENKPNDAWKDGHNLAIEYITRFIGLCEHEDQIKKVSETLLSTYQYEDDRSRYRYVIFAEEPNEHYRAKGITYISYLDAVRFLVEVRGECWSKANIGVASVHYQWIPLINEIFKIANDIGRPIAERCDQILKEILEPSQTGNPN